MNNTRFSAFLGIMIAIPLLYVVFGHAGREEIRHYPTSEQLYDNGLKVLKTWLKHNGIEAYSFKKRLKELTQLPLHNDQGNLLVISLPSRFPYQYHEFDKIKEWLETYNHILFLIDTKQLKSFYQIKNMCDHLGISVGISNNKNTNESGYPPFTDLNISAKQESMLSMKFDNSFDLLTANSEPVISYFKDKGSIWFVQNPLVFSNSALRELDNAKLFSTILDFTIGNHGSVIFDDFHLGLSLLYDVEKMYQDPRFLQTIVSLVVLWLIYAFGYFNRLGPIVKKGTINSNIHFVKASGNFYARFLSKHQVALSLISFFQADIRRLTKNNLESDNISALLPSNLPVSSHNRRQYAILINQITQQKSFSLKKLYVTLLSIRKESL